MRVSYLGIITNQQLRVWVPETEHAAQFLTRRANESSADTIFWATLAECDARQIEELLSLGHDTEAVRLLKNAAAECGRLLPMRDDDLPCVKRCG